jgi:small neutral amino acid transporter SnatA (MarC family)
MLLNQDTFKQKTTRSIVTYCYSSCFLKVALYYDSSDRERELLHELILGARINIIILYAGQKFLKFNLAFNQKR